MSAIIFWVLSKKKRKGVVDKKMFCGIIVNMEKLNQMDTQLLIENVKISPTVCVFTGHRILGADFSARKLKKEIIRET